MTVSSSSSSFGYAFVPRAGLAMSSMSRARIASTSIRQLRILQPHSILSPIFSTSMRSVFRRRALRLTCKLAGSMTRQLMEPLGHRNSLVLSIVLLETRQEIEEFDVPLAQMGPKGRLVHFVFVGTVMRWSQKIGQGVKVYSTG